MPEWATPDELDTDVLRDLRGLSKDGAEFVAGHLVAAGSLADEEPALAWLHARAARARGGRIAVVRETVGLVAYRAGEWAEAIGELRAARRMGGGPGHLAVIADSERALGHPERAIELSRSAEADDLDEDAAIELAIVVAGARADLGQIDAALAHLERIGWREDAPNPRIAYAYADLLLQAGRRQEALTWFVRAADADADEETDAGERLAQLSASLDETGSGGVTAGPAAESAQPDDVVHEVDHAAVTDVESDGPGVDEIAPAGSPATSEAEVGHDAEIDDAEISDSDFDNTALDNTALDNTAIETEEPQRVDAISGEDAADSDARDSDAATDGDRDGDGGAGDGGAGDGGAGDGDGGAGDGGDVTEVIAEVDASASGTGPPAEEDPSAAAAASVTDTGSDRVGTDSTETDDTETDDTETDDTETDDTETGGTETGGTEGITVERTDPTVDADPDAGSGAADVGPSVDPLFVPPLFSDDPLAGDR